MHPVFAAWSSFCKPRPWCILGGPNSLAPLHLSAAGYAGWDPSAGLELSAWLHWCPGFSLMCLNSFPGAAPLLARHTCKSCPSPPRLSKTSQRTRHLPGTNYPWGQTRGQERAGDEMSTCFSPKPFPLLLQEQLCTCGMEGLTEILFGYWGGISVPVLGKYNSGMKVSRELKIHFS